MKIAKLTVAFCAIMAVAGAGRAADAGAAVEVAGKAAGSRSQTWAASAWAAESKTWLVVWREGYLNDESSEIWGARVDASGTALDPNGICLAKGAGLKDRPRVASDGKGWLVVWQDMRNKADTSGKAPKGWDVYAGRVSASGKALDEGGVMLTGGDHNQCRPDIAFTKENYYVVWQGFDTGYSVLGMRVSSDGKSLDEKATEIAAVAGRPSTQAYNASVSVRGEKMLVVGYVDPIAMGRPYLFNRFVDPATGQALGLPPKPCTTSSGGKPVVAGEEERWMPVALGDAGAMIASVPCYNGAYKGLIRLSLLDLNGQPVGDEKGIVIGPNPPAGLTPRYALVFAGKDFLVAADFVKGGGKGVPYRMEIHGWHVAPDGKVADDPKNGFVIAADAGKDQTLPSLALGPDGSVLAVWSEVRGVDDIKVMARILK